MTDPLFEYIVTTDSFNRDWIVCQSLLYRIILKIIKKEDYSDLICNCRDVLHNLNFNMTSKEREKYIIRTRKDCDYVKMCLVNNWTVLDFIDIVKQKEGRI